MKGSQPISKIRVQTPWGAWACPNMPDLAPISLKMDHRSTCSTFSEEVSDQLWLESLESARGMSLATFSGNRMSFGGQVVEIFKFFEGRYFFLSYRERIWRPDFISRERLVRSGWFYAQMNRKTRFHMSVSYDICL